jgi:hypothetical protein
MPLYSQYGTDSGFSYRRSPHKNSGVRGVTKTMDLWFNFLIALLTPQVLAGFAAYTMGYIKGLKIKKALLKGLRFRSVLGRDLNLITA